MTPSRKERLHAILKAIEESPYPDGETTFALDLPPIVLFVRVEDDYTVYYGVVGYPARNDRIISVYAIKETDGSIQEMLNSPWD